MRGRGPETNLQGLLDYIAIKLVAPRKRSRMETQRKHVLESCCSCTSVPDDTTWGPDLHDTARSTPVRREGFT